MKLSAEQQSFLKIIINKGLILISIAWIMLLLGWLFIEEPFGSRVSNREIRELLILLSVPLMGLWLIGRLLYKYLIKSKKITSNLNNYLAVFKFKKYFSNKAYNIVMVLLFSFIVIEYYQIIQLKNKITYMSYSVSDNESSTRSNSYSISEVEGKVSDNENNLSDSGDRISDLYGRVSDVEQDLRNQSYKLHEHY